MSIFDQRNQKVNYQYNAAGDINFGAVQNRLDFIGELEKLRDEFNRARQQNVFDEETAIEAGSKLDLAVVEAKKPQPNKQTLLERVKGTKTLIEGVTAASGMVTALTKAAELIQQFF